MVPTTDNGMALEKVVNKLATIGTAFIAVPMRSLGGGNIGFLTYAPGNVAFDEYVRELDTIDYVTFDENKFGFLGVGDVLCSDVHFQQRVPIYASGNAMFGLPDLSVETGLSNLREYRTRGHVPSESVSFEFLAQELIDAGAVAISLEKELFELSNDSKLPLRAHMPPVTGQEIAGKYNNIRFDGEKYGFQIETVLDGPGFLGKVPVYAGDDIIGMDPVPLEDGVENLHTYLSNHSGTEDTVQS